MRMERKLAAILSADVHGYSRLMGEDEEATLRTLAACREVMATLIQQHRGRVVDSPGDNLLAEFASVVDAVRCAVEIQQALKAQNADLPASRRMEFRMGVNLGDVVVEGKKLYGEGVNLAARLERLAEPGGICISGGVHDQVENKLSLEYEDLGEQQVKNIARPVRVYRVRGEVGATTVSHKASQSKGPGQAKKARSRPRRRVALAVAVVLLLGAGVIVIQALSGRLSRVWLDQPSIAVLPFTNRSGDPGQDSFIDGLTEELITQFSKIPGLFVVARNSTFAYKGKPVDVIQVGRELGARYVLEGSVRKSGSRVRITAQLVDATTGGHLWAESYDRELRDLLAVQDEITQRIIGAVTMKAIETKPRWVRLYYPTKNMEAYEYFLRGDKYLGQLTKEATAQARQMFEKAIALDPKFALAYAKLAITYRVDWLFQWSQDPRSVERAFALAQKAVALDDSKPYVHTVLGLVYLSRRQYEQALVEGVRAVALGPNDAGVCISLAAILNNVGRPQEAIGLAEKAMRLDPLYPPSYLTVLGEVYSLTGRTEEAMATLKRAVARNPNLLFAHIGLAILYSKSGRGEEARAEVAEILRINPHYSLEGMRQRSSYKDRAGFERRLALLRKAGLQ